MRIKILRLARPLVILAAIAVLGAAVMVLWNLVMPAILAGSHAIDYPHSVGLLVLCRILFGGFRGRGGWRRHRHWHGWAALTPEERERILRHRSPPFDRSQT
jgi:hypothetical protein